MDVTAIDLLARLLVDRSRFLVDALVDRRLHYGGALVPEVWGLDITHAARAIRKLNSLTAETASPVDRPKRCLSSGAVPFVAGSIDQPLDGLLDRSRVFVIHGGEVDHAAFSPSPRKKARSFPRSATH